MCIVSTVVSTLPASIYGPQTTGTAHNSASQWRSLLNTHIPQPTSWRSLWSGHNGRNERQWKDVFWRHEGSFLPCFLEAVQQGLLRASWDEGSRRATSVLSVQVLRFPARRRPRGQSPKSKTDQGRDVVLFSSSSSPLHHHHYWDGLTPRAAGPECVWLGVCADTHTQSDLLRVNRANRRGQMHSTKTQQGQ